MSFTRGNTLQLNSLFRVDTQKTWPHTVQAKQYYSVSQSLITTMKKNTAC